MKNHTQPNPQFNRGDIVYVKKKYVNETFSLNFAEKVLFELGMPYVVDRVMYVTHTTTANKKVSEFEVLVFGASQYASEKIFQRTSPIEEETGSTPSADNSKYEEFCDFVFKYATKNKLRPIQDRGCSYADIYFQKFTSSVRIHQNVSNKNSGSLVMELSCDFFEYNPSYEKRVTISSVEEILVELEKLIAYSQKFDKALKSIKKHYKSIEKLAGEVGADVDDILSLNINID